MTILRPVTTKSPSSVEALEDSGLPFGFVLTPFALRSAVSQGNDDIFNQKRKVAKPSRSCDAFPTKASLIAKCTHCGSPLNPTCQILDCWRVLCTICGKTYGADFDSQRDARMQANGTFQPRKDDEDELYYEEAEYSQRYSSKFRQEERCDPIVEYSLPLLSINSPSSRRDKDIYALPSNQCPPLLAIFIDGTSSDAEYYEKIAKTLQTLIDCETDEFKGSRIGIFVMTANGGLSVFDFTNPGGHIKHLWVNQCPLKLNQDYHKHENNKWESEEEYNFASLVDLMTAEQIFAPLDGIERSYVENALRELADSAIFMKQACQREKARGDSGAYLGSTLQYFLEFMEEVAYHPGEMQKVNNNDGSSVALSPHEKFIYAGGKIMCFLSKAPEEIGNEPIVGKNGRPGRGGFGGACAEVGRRFGSVTNGTDQVSDCPENDIDDVEAGGVKSGQVNGSSTSMQNGNRSIELPPTKFLNVDEYYQDLGITCAIGAFGVELFALLRTDDCVDENAEKYFGIPLLRLLSDRSGGSGPLLISLDAQIGPDSDDVLLNEVIARCPWKRNIAFGSMLRVRSSQSLLMDKVEGTTARSRRKSKLGSDNLRDFYNSNGIFGSATSSPDDDELFLIGAMDNSHTISFDLQICSRNGKIEDFASLDSGREYKLKPIIQSCFAYTGVVKNKGKWLTIRRLRVATYELNLEDDVEIITSSLDMEVLAFSIFHKFQAQGLQFGLDSIQDFANEFILSTLLCCYESAQKMEGKINRYGDSVAHESFYLNDRLVNSKGTAKSRRDALLGQGHDVLQHLPLVIFSLFQCDALRPNSGDFNPSVDARAAAAANMSNMTPDVIVRCIAPRIEFWISGKDTNEALDESVNMNIRDIRYTIVDQIATADGEKYQKIVPLLFVDAPYNTFIYDLRDLYNLRPATEDDLPDALLETKNEAVASYRVPPPTFVSTYEDDHIAAYRAYSCFKDVLVEDSVTSSKHESFEGWCIVLAEILFFEITKLSS